MIPASKGTYILALELRDEERIVVGRAGTFSFEAGTYLYVGSAHGPGGLSARLARHARRGKTRRWHVDYLRERAQLVGAFCRAGGRELECEWATWLGSRSTRPHDGIGCSDCRCSAHLFSVHTVAAFERLARDIEDELAAELVIVGNLQP